MFNFILLYVSYTHVCVFSFSFSENAKRVSSLFRDRPMTPSESVVYWVEYLIRHGTEANIRPLSADSSWTSHFMLDICVALATALLILWFLKRAIAHAVFNKSIPSAVKWWTSIRVRVRSGEANRIIQWYSRLWAF